MRAITTQDIYKQFPDVDGFWADKTLSQTEFAIRETLHQQQSDDQKLNRIETLTQLVRLLNILGNPSEAAATLKQAQDIIASCEPSAHRIRAEIRLALEHGRHLWLARNPARAQSFLNHAWTLATTNKEYFFAIDAALMLAITQPPKFQNEWINKALNLAEKTDEPQAKLWLTHLYLVKGWQFFDFHRYDEALQNFTKAFERPRDKGVTTNLQVIRWSMARALRSLNKLSEALEIQNTLLVELSSAGQKNGFVLLEIAECLQLLQKTEEAKSFYESAYNELSADTWYLDNHKAELNRMQFLYKLR